MEVHLKPETESRLHQLASQSGRPTDELVEDAMAGYLREVSDLRSMLDSRYDDVKSGKVQPVDGEAVFARLRQKSEKRRSQRS
jgi:predicted DNA-binding protein